MLQVFQSNRLEALVTLLAEQLKYPTSNDMLEAETILVQSPGMSQWLKLQIAEHNGIAANIQFPLPSSFIWRLYQSLLDDVPEQSPFNKDKLTWKIFDLLPDFLSHQAFKAVQEYLSVNKHITQEEVVAETQNAQWLRRFQLASKIADVYDNYLMYRPNWLVHWQQGHDDLPMPDSMSDSMVGQEWQAILWRAIVAIVEEKNQSPLHRASMHELLLKQLKSLTTEQINARLDKPLRRLFIFGISTLPQHQLQILDALSSHIDVQILWLNPSQEFWGDVLSAKTLARLSNKQADLAEINVLHKNEYFVTGNPILANWGKIGRDYLDSLSNMDLDFHDVFIQQNDSQPLSLLEHIQSDILKLEYRGTQSPLTPEQIHSDFGKRSLSFGDDSIVVHNCHSRIRELEVLKDKLLSWFQQYPDLSPKDVLIMVPDINQYSPFIDSVFAKPAVQQESESKQYIPYTIADRGGLEENPILNTFIGLLSLPMSRFEVSELIDYLELPSMLHRFDIDLAELNLIKTWIEQCHIKWAKDAKQKQKWQLPQIDLNTWLYGLKRMVLGVSLDSDDIWQGTLPYNQIEGLNAITLGKLINYFSFIAYLESHLGKVRDLNQWSDFIEQFVADVFEFDGMIDVKETVTIQMIRQATEKFRLYNKEHDYEGPVSHSIVQQFFAQELNESGVVQRFLAGKMNFCTLMPMRSVPFKIVCVLGLNEGDYPRQVDPISFDLIALNTPRKGDRSRKLDDRYLFLEALTSARMKLHLSYVGQSVKDNSEIMPSVILSELCQYLQESFYLSNQQDVLAHLIIKHKLQPFDKDYYQQHAFSPLYQTFQHQWYKLLTSQAESLPTAKEKTSSNMIINDNKELELNDFLEYWRHPIKYFYRRILGINLDIDENELVDHEVFEHKGLAKFKAAESLFTQLVQQDGFNQDGYLRSGEFPLENWGKSVLQQYKQTSEAQFQLLLQVLNTTEQEYADDIRLIKTHLSNEGVSSDNKLQGQIELFGINSTQKELSVLIRTGKIRNQDKLEAWLIHLFKSASLKGSTTVIVGLDKNKPVIAWYQPIQVEQAQDYLNAFVDIYLDTKVHNTLNVWHVRPALDWLIQKEKGVSPLVLQGVISGELKPNNFSRNLFSDEYASKHLSQLKDFDDMFFAKAEQLLMPLIEAYCTDKPEKAIDAIHEINGADNHG